ncbi:hypothetical protein Efla_002550 [Eimeria flavescens]
MSVPCRAAFLERDEDRTQPVESSSELEKNHLPVNTKRLRRCGLHQCTTVLVLISVLAYLTVMTTCLKEVRERVALKGDSRGRRLGSQNESEDQGDENVSMLVSSCIPQQARTGDRAGQAMALETEMAVSSTITSMNDFGRETTTNPSTTSTWVRLRSVDYPPKAADEEHNFAKQALWSRGYSGFQAPKRTFELSADYSLSGQSAAYNIMDPTKAFLNQANEGRTEEAEQAGLQQAQAAVKWRSLQKAHNGETTQQSKRQGRGPWLNEEETRHEWASANLGTSLPAAATMESQRVTVSGTARSASGPAAPTLESHCKGGSGTTHSALDLSTATPESHWRVLSDTAHDAAATRVQPGSLSGGDSPGPSEVHLLYRLPVVEKGQLGKIFDVDFAHVKGTHRHNAQLTFRHVRALLAQPRLSLQQAEELIVDTEQLVNYLLTFHTSASRAMNPYKTVQVLGCRYFFLEAVFCVIQVLGPAMRPELWWWDFVAKIPSHHPMKALKSTERTEQLVNLCERLSSALAMLKAGMRPSQAATVDLKRRLVNVHQTVRYFKKSHIGRLQYEQGASGGSKKIVFRVALPT